MSLGQVAPWMGLGGVLLAVGSLLVAYWRTGAPPVPAKGSEIADVVALLAGAGLPTGAHIYELGCGWGGLALAIARARPDARVVGLELSPLPCAVAWLRGRRVANLDIRCADFHRVALGGADAVTCYLMIAPMVPLAATLDRQLRPGTPVVALTFGFRDRQVAQSRRGSGVRGVASLYRWPAR